MSIVHGSYIHVDETILVSRFDSTMVNKISLTDARVYAKKKKKR